ncbi:transcriptional regulator, AraC family [Pseudonocardia thermophila]|jgi:AraC-type DNA-binding domain-containing proteins|uniref:Transcriptional regulator, AraC family n=1 Tax=Pseudonocardia thermophila TaxID=1848 RepID=A0A1M6VE01_PSETH|nr:AraC family transcriptional regulator [Pseudonocardia thermophila]SHK79700.1 transcriptional regulator, AraC family [Pseudonocardia thermophila]
MAVWDVAARPANEQFGYWREVICAAFVPLTPFRMEPGEGFRSRVETRPLSRVVRARIASQPQRTSHGPVEVARTTGEYFFVNLQTAGTCAVEQDGRRSIVRPGQFTLVDTAAPYHFEFAQPWGMVSYRIPHELLGGRLAEVRAQTGRCWDATGAGGVVTAVLAAMWDLTADGPAAIDVEQALAAAVSAAAAERAGPPADRYAALRAEVVRRVDEWLGDPTLSVTSVSRRLGVSPRTLHTAVSAGGETFAALVRRRRMERAHELLTTRRGATVTEIAAAVGYDGPAAFSRAFRREFGCTPTEVRRGARTAQQLRTD